MLKIDDEKTIHVTRGDSGTIVITAQDIENNDYIFQTNDLLRLKVMKKNNVEEIVLIKDVTVASDTTRVDIELTSQDTKIGDYINKPNTYWYEVELNPNDNSTTIIGYDENGPKKFKLYPEGKENE